MSKTIVGQFVAFALAIAPAFYCAPSWAGSLAPEAAKAVEEVVKAAPKAEEKPRVSLENAAKRVGEEVGNEVVRKNFEAFGKCLEEHVSPEDCTVAPK
jgi:hypothetical protein